MGRYNVKHELDLDITYMKEWHPKEYAIKLLRGGLWTPKNIEYIYMLNFVYPNSYVKMH